MLTPGYPNGWLNYRELLAMVQFRRGLCFVWLRLHTHIYLKLHPAGELLKVFLVINKSIQAYS